jgi:hypothetical protein
MKNQPITNSSKTAPIGSVPISQSPVVNQVKTNLLVPILSTLLVSAIVFGFGGYYLGKQTSNNVQQPVANQNKPITTLPTEVLPSPTNTPTPVGLTTYTSSFEKLSFKYPTDWKIVQSKPESNFPEGDSLSIQSPTGKITVAWISAIDGLGGGCDANAPVGSAEGCPLYEVMEKQKIPNTNFNYVAYIITTDGTHYSPSFALQDDQGILTTSRTMGYLLFTGKNNGGESAGLVAGSVPYGRGLTSGTKAEAQNFFSTPEAVQAKNILLSVTY